MKDKDQVQRFIGKSKKISGRSRIIPNIFEYCDRWCDRCAFTSRCSLYLSEHEKCLAEISDTEKLEFWNRMSLVFESTTEMIQGSAHKFGIDCDDLDRTGLPELEESEVEQFARDYTLDIHDWLKENQDYFDEQLVSGSSTSSEKIISLTDAFEVIEWYSMFITAKTHRAFNSCRDENDTVGKIADSLGSAKIAVIGIERSLNAFTTLFHQFLELEDDLLGFMVQLEKLKKGILVALPGAMEFKRPGFDD